MSTIKCPLCNWELGPVERFGRILYAHTFEVDDNYRPIGKGLPPESCNYLGKFLNTDKSLYVPHGGYRGGKDTVVREARTGRWIPDVPPRKLGITKYAE